MKRTILACAIAMAAVTAHGQMSTYVLQPASLVGALEFTTTSGSGWTMMPDMNDPANRVQGMAALVDDGTEADSLGCGALVNGADVAGKIAFVYRGVCNFSLKALMAQNAGAIGVVIANNTSAAPIPLGAGDDAGSITIPVVMITQAAGALLHDEVVAGNVEIMIGNPQGMLPNNLALKMEKMLIPPQAARPEQVSTSDDNFSVQLGGWVYNYGSAPQSTASLKATVTHDGSTVYEETSLPATIAPGDSALFTLPPFSQPTGYSGRYEFTYTAQMDESDDIPDDNTYSTTAVFGSLLSYSPLDDDNLPVQDAFYQPATEFESWEICGGFVSPHADRLTADGLYAAAAVNSPDTMEGRLLTTSLYEWDGSDLATINLVLNGEYAYTANLNTDVVYVPFFESFQMMNDQPYLFCVSSSDPDVFLGHTNRVNYDETESATDEFTTVIHRDDAWTRWATGEVPAMALKTSGTVGIHERNFVELTPYPNPTRSSISIPTTGLTGKASIQVIDSKGAKVADRQVTISGNNLLTMDLGNLNGGVYMFHVLCENGTQSSFRVVVTK